MHRLKLPLLPEDLDLCVLLDSAAVMTSVQGDHNTQFPLISEQTAAFYTGNEFLGLVEVFFSYKTSSKTGIMKNKCIPQTLSASLEIKK